MESKIISQEKNLFLKRDEMVFEINSEVSPRIEDLKKITGKNENLIVIKKVNSNFGKHKFVVESFVYESEDAKNNIEMIPKKTREKLETEKKASEEAEKATMSEAVTSEEAPAEEAPATEEVKEEAPVEEAPATEEVKEEAPAEEAPATEEVKENVDGD